jgi:hypothetical protein
VQKEKAIKPNRRRKAVRNWTQVLVKERIRRQSQSPQVVPEEVEEEKRND